MAVIRTLAGIATLTVAAQLSGAGVVFAANYPLEITNIRSGLDAGNRLTRAYPGLEYSVRVAVIGGTFPYTFALHDAPAGMQIDSHRGTITWPSPQSDAVPTVTVVDAAGASTSATWAIAVGTAAFRFVDAVNGKPAREAGCVVDCGDGTRARPWRSLMDVHRSGAAGAVVYFRRGTYTLAGIPRASSGTPWERVEFGERTMPVAWLAYPGERPVIDFGHGADRTGALIRLQGDNVYIDGFETINTNKIGFQFVAGRGDLGPTFRRLRMHALLAGVDGANAAFIMTVTNPEPARFMVVQDSEFWDVSGGAVTIKIYAQEKLLIEDTTHHDAPEAIHLKDDVPQFTVRGNRFLDISSVAIGGNMHERTTHGEILFNNARAGIALDLNQDGMAGPIHVYRNTFVGRVRVRNTDAADGPFTLTNNVIVSQDSGGWRRGSRISTSDVSAPQRILASDNLTGSPRDNVVDADGKLTKAYARFQGVMGYQLP